MSFSKVPYLATSVPVAEESQAMPVGDVSKKEKQAAKAAGEAEAARQAAEDAEWAEGGKKANKKKEAEAEKKAAKAERKAENDALAEAEEAELSAPKLTGNKAKPAKMTRAEIAAQAMAKLEAEQKSKKKEKKAVEVSGGNEYIGVLAENENRADTISGSGVDDAIAALTIATSGAGSSGDGKKVNLKAAFAAFEEREIVRLKEENPGLKLSQYKERAFKAWEKSPENAANAAVDLS